MAPRRTLIGIVSRLLVRVAIVLASLAWAGYVFTHTVGDPGRGERIAAAVLEDDAARAEVVAPVASAVMRTTGLPDEQRPFVETQVDLLLADPVGARSFIEPFAGSWARLLGEDDPRPAEFDVAPLLSRLVPDAETDGIVTPETLPVSGVPLPRSRLDWLGGVRSAIAAAVVPLAAAAASSFVIAFAVGDRARVLRRLGVWAILAGLSWVVLPPLLVWLARRWAPGADAVVAVALDEAVSGLLAAALVLVGGGGIALAASFVTVRPARRPTGARAVDRGPRRSTARATPLPPTPTARPAGPPRRTVAATADMPVVPSGARPASGATGEPHPEERTVDDGDALWEYYSSKPR